MEKASKDDRVKKSLIYSIADGTFYSTMVGFGESFFTVFATFLKANNFEIGLIGSLPMVLGSVFQLITAKLLKLFKSRKRFVCTGALLQGFMYLFIMIAFLFGKFSSAYLIIFVCIYWIVGSILAPAWNSWMGDLVDEKKRGDYFGKRNRITGFAAFFSLLLAGYILQRFAGKYQYLGFIIIFGIAFVSRIFSFIYLSKQYEPQYKLENGTSFNLIEFVKKARFHDFELFAIYSLFINLFVYVSAPFFVAYMIYDLKLSYMEYTVILSAALIVKYTMMPVWGKACDRFGTRKVLSLTSILMPLSPILWLFSSNFYWLITIQIYAGFTWAGFELASFNYIFDITGSDKRTSSFAYYNVLNGIGILFGGIIGSIIVKYNHAFWSVYLLVFLLSGIGRWVAAVVFVPRLKEERAVQHIPYHKLLFDVVNPMPTIGIVRNIIKNKGKKPDEDISEWD